MINTVKIIFLISLHLLAKLIYSQDKIFADSLFNIWQNTKNHDTQRVIAIDELAWNYQIMEQNDSALKYTDIELNFIKNKNLKKWEANVYNNYGLIYINKKDIKAFNCFEKAIAIRKELNDKKGEAGAYVNIGSAHKTIINDHESAITFYLKALNIYEKINDIEGKTLVNYNISLLYSELAEYKTALNYSQKLLKLAKIKNDNYLTVVAYVALSHNYKNIEMHDSSLYYINEGLKISKKNNFNTLSVNLLDISANTFISIKNYAKALEIASEMLTISKKSQYSKGIYLSHLLMGNIYFIQDNYDDANKKFQEALLYIDSTEINLLADLYSNLYKANKHLKNYKQSLFYFEQHKLLSENSNKLNNKKKL